MFEELLTQQTPLPPAPVLPTLPRPAEPKNFNWQRLRKKWPFSFVGTLLIVAMIIGIPTVSYFAYQTYSNASDSEKWPSVKGTITQTSVEEKKKRKFGYEYIPHVAYRFQVNDREYHGDRIAFLHQESFDSEEEAQEYLKNRPVNSTCKVFYDPKNPSNCTLEKGASSSGILLLIFVPLALLGVGIKFLWELQSEKKGKQNDS